MTYPTTNQEDDVEASSVNAPHPDATADDAEDFFGEGSTGVRSAEAMAAEAQEYRESHGEPDPDPETTQSAERTEELAGAATEPAPKSGGNLEREYIVFQEVKLTERTLKHLLSRIEHGEVRVAFIELHRATTRHDRAAIGEAYVANKELLGERCDLAAVSSRAFKKRHIEPEEVPAERRIKIT